MEPPSKSDDKAPGNGLSLSSQRLHGPFHRLRSTTQTDEVAAQQSESLEVWGRPRQYSNIPQVQAYMGPLPATAAGVEFYSLPPPDTGTAPGHVRWTGPRPGVVIQDEFAKIKVQITQQIQILG